MRRAAADILRARLQTIGVEEHTLVFEAGECFIYLLEEYRQPLNNLKARDNPLLHSQVKHGSSTMSEVARVNEVTPFCLVRISILTFAFYLFTAAWAPYFDDGVYQNASD